MAETQKRPVAVVIPAKGTSTRVPRKNLALWRGKPLVVSSIEYALAEGHVPHVASDDQEILLLAERSGALIHVEPPDLVASRPSDVARWIAGPLEADVVILHPTTPDRRPGLIDRAAALLVDHDSVYAGLPLPGHIVLDRRGYVTNRRWPILDALDSQEMARDPQWVVSGVIFAARHPGYLTQRYILFGRVGVIEITALEMLDIDWPEDLHRQAEGGDHV